MTNFQIRKRKIVGASGAPLKYTGEAVVKFKLGPRTFEKTFWMGKRDELLIIPVWNRRQWIRKNPGARKIDSKALNGLLV